MLSLWAQKTGTNKESRKKAILSLSLGSVIGAFQPDSGGGVVITTVLRADIDLYMPRLDSGHLQGPWACVCLRMT